ncbi:hypothetical protein MJO13_22305, partial [Salmonella enterica subsp. enterica serovar Lubbock]|nr:hypothetical protein [Salmonella enterica subsp. enterica serovar Lubbock]
MIAMILVHPHIFWLSLGGLLLAAEMLGGNGYLLWSGVAAVITGLTVWLLPSTPYTTDAHGRGPAWANSLFEDN